MHPVNPYEPPVAIVDDQPSVARVLALRIGAAICALVAGLTATIFVVIVASVHFRELGFSIVYYPIFTVLFGKLAHYLWVRGGVSRPQAVAEDAAADLEIIAGIVARPSIAEVPQGDPGGYAGLPAKDLLAVFRDINPERAGARYAELINAMRSTVGKGEGKGKGKGKG